MKSKLYKVLFFFIGTYLFILTLFYFFQEKVIFLPIKLDENYQYQFDNEFEELYFTTTDNKTLNALLFKTKNPKGLVFYLHGNSGNLASWGEVSKVYTDLGYDVFMFDYRSYGKSEGNISNEKQLHEDIQIVYNQIKTKYAEEEIVILGYSIGTGFASRLASKNQPKLLILQAPYYSLTDILKWRMPLAPTFILKYKLETNLYLKKCTMPVYIFHGDRDKVIYYGSSLKLKAEFKPADSLITLRGQGHNGITNNQDYLNALELILYSK